MLKWIVAIGWIPFSLCAQDLPRDLAQFAKTQKIDISQMGNDSLEKLIERYDYLAPRQGEDLKIEKRCQSLPKMPANGSSGHEMKVIDPLCQKFLENRRKISSSPIFLNLAGWAKSGAVLAHRHYANTSKLRQLENESESPLAYLKKNFVKYVTDPTYRCRRPSLYNYFSQNFSYSPFSNIPCSPRNKIPYLQVKGNSKNIHNYSLLPNRIYQIDYLMAEGGKDMASQWGHAMVRLVRCAPTRKYVGPECLQDTAHHLVFSFVADINDFVLNNVKGTSGAYDSILTISPYHEIVRRYVYHEGRDLHSYPLKLNENGKIAFVNRLLEYFWLYRGKYYFLGNNCSTELINLFSPLELSNLQLQEASPSTPKALLKLLHKSGLIIAQDSETMTDPSFEGHYIDLPPNRHSYDKNILIKKMNELEYEINDRVMKYSSSKERAQLDLWSAELVSLTQFLVRGDLVSGYGVPLAQDVRPHGAGLMEIKGKRVDYLEQQIIQKKLLYAPDLIDQLRQTNSELNNLIEEEK